MRKIILCCACGMSTSVLVKNMKKAADDMGYEVEISAHAVTEVKKLGQDVDIILLGPQIAFQHKKVQKELPEKPVHVIDMKDYGMMDGKAVINFVKKTLGD